MSRKYLNGKWCVRCGKTTPTPYLSKNLKLLPEKGKVLDIGCGNGRNSRHMMSLGYKVEPVDMAPPKFGSKIILGQESLPKKKYDIILANYILMFLNQKERKFVMSEIQERSREGTVLIMEMYPAKDAHDYDFEKIVAYYLKKGWEKLRKSKDKCVLRRIEA
jgi:SAM-dependent methyltransferase